MESPPFEWIKINVDGSMDLTTGAISAGGNVRDHMKKWQGGFVRNISIGNVLEAELWGILEGLKLVWKEGGY